MKATFLQKIRTARDTMEAFGGYDARTRIKEGNFAKECNLTSRHYPVMGGRDPRAVLANIEGLQGLLVKDKLAWIANRTLYYDGEAVKGFSFTAGQKTMLSMGARIVVYPDRVAYNTVTGKCERIITDRLLRDTSNLYVVMMHDIKNSQHYNTLPDGTPSNSAYVPKEGDFAHIVTGDARHGRNVYYQYNGGKFEPVVSDKLKIKVDFWYEKVGDYEYTIAEEQKALFDAVKALRGHITVWNESELLTCRIDQVELVGGSYAGSGDKDIYLYVTAERPIDATEIIEDWYVDYTQAPILDGVIESGNRLWGYRYGEAMNGEFTNEIYATALGSPADWYTKEGIASDSYTVSVGSDGRFTGAIYYSGSIYFFKERGFHRVMGKKPSNFQVSFVNCNGVEEGSERSLILHGDAIYYKGVDGIYRYDGSLPYKISDALGDKRYRNAVAGAIGNRLYFEMEDDVGIRSTFVYDVKRSIWHVENAVGAKQFVSAFGNLMYMTENTMGVVQGNDIDESFSRVFKAIEREGDVPWFCEFGDLGLSNPYAKYISKLQLRMSAEKDVSVTVEASYDSGRSWETLAVLSVRGKGSQCLPVVTQRCDHFRLRLSGTGACKLWTLTKEIESTNEVRE